VPYRLESRTFVPASVPDVFQFFTEVRNLPRVLPPFLRCRILTPDVAIRSGARVDYRLRLRGVPLRWQSEITTWEPNVRFKDEQRRGPFTYWRHVHLFRADGSGTLIEDGVEYATPGGRLVHNWIVAPELIRIFRYRQQALARIFGEDPRQAAKVAIVKLSLSGSAHRRG
jgi:ligand-binding SRPBCC domain-containing protein